MKLKDLNVGDKFLFVNGGVLTDIYVVKRKHEDFYEVGAPNVYDVFAAFLDEEVIAEK